MKHLFLITVLFLAFTMALSAQTHNSQGYAYYGFSAPGDGGEIGRVQSLGAGGEAFIWRGLAAGGDAGYMFARDQFAYGLGQMTANGSYHFTNRERSTKLVPFVTVGYGLFFRLETISTVNYGGGATWWFNNHLGFRAEARNFQASFGRFDTAVRLGLSFR